MPLVAYHNLGVGLGASEFDSLNLNGIWAFEYLCCVGSTNLGLATLF